METGSLKRAEVIIKERGLTVATAESCTGGLLAAEFVSLPGSSNWFSEGCVTYTIPAKISRLHVNEATIEKYTVVSREVALEMARGIRQNLNASIGISTTGYAGPGGGDDKNPVGTVFIAVVSNDREMCERLSLTGGRNEIRREAVEKALDLLCDFLGKKC